MLADKIIFIFGKRFISLLNGIWETDESDRRKALYLFYTRMNSWAAFITFI